MADDEPFLGIRVNVDIEEEDGHAPAGTLPGGRADRGTRTVGLADNCSYYRDVVEERFLGGNVARMNKAQKHEVMERVH